MSDAPLDEEPTDRLSEADGQVVLDAVDGAFQQTLHGRYGGGVMAILKRAGDDVDQHPLRPVPAGLQDSIVVELNLRGTTDTDTVPAFAHAASIGMTAIGVITMVDPPGRGAADIHVLTEVFDDMDPNDAADNGCFSTGILLSETPQGKAGQMPGRGVYVVRNGASEREDAIADRQAQRGWLPRQPRTQANRAAGLGNNGHRRSPVPTLTCPVSRALLKHIGDHVAQARTVGGALERVVVGVQIGVTVPP